MQIALTALVTILAGALTLVVGQIIASGALDHALELKRLIGTIAHDMDFYANRFLQCKPEEEQAWRKKFSEHAYSLREKLAFIIWYRIFEILFRLPPKKCCSGSQLSNNRILKSSSRTALGAFARRKDQRTTSHKDQRFADSSSRNAVSFSSARTLPTPR
jgi:hypothetical protein